MTGNCLHCGKEHTWAKTSTGKYCSNKCQGSARHKSCLDSWLVGGNNPGIKTMRKHLLSINDCCWECGIKEWNGKPIVLELEHCDGNGYNNNISNLKMLCPNCHSQTPTYKNKNKGNGRLERRLRANKDNARVA